MFVFLVSDKIIVQVCHQEAQPGIIFVLTVHKKEVGRSPLLSGLGRNPKYMHKRPTHEVGVCALYIFEPAEFERKGTHNLWAKVQNCRQSTKWEITKETAQ